MGVTCPDCGTDNTQDSEFCKKCGTQIIDSEEKPLPTQTIEAPREELTTGSSFAERYQIVEELGKGGMGKVYRALDKKLNEEVALKLIKPEIASDKKTLERFQNELKLARKISHRNVGRMYELLEDKGTNYITMEYVSGQDLKSLIRQTGQLAIPTALSIAKQICEGLSEAHQLGIIHRDLKPSNILIDKDGNARIMDFGIARSVEGKGITGAGVMIGTPEYMPPEQAEAKEVDQRSDIYSLGVILYEMLTGRVPFEGDTALSIAMKHKGEEPKDPREFNSQISEDLSQVILRSLKKEKDKRYQSASELLSDLDNVESGIPTTERLIPERKPLTSREITVQFSMKKIYIPILIVVTIAVIGLILWQFLPKKGASPIPSDRPSVAIMYFMNETGDESLDHWRSALSRWLITDLSQSKYMHVLPGDRLFSILRKHNLLDAQGYASEDLEIVASEGNVNHIFQASLTKAGDIFRVDYSLQKADTLEIIASDFVTGTSEQSFPSLVDEMTRKIKTHLDFSEELIAADFDKAVGEITTTSPEAFKYYVEGRKLFSQSEFRKSIEIMEKAMAIDPEFAMAYRSIAVSYNNLGYRTEGWKYLEKALELKDRLSEREAYLIQGQKHWQTPGELEKAYEMFEKVLDIYPEDGIAITNFISVGNSMDKYDKSIEIGEKAISSNTEIKGFIIYHLCRAYWAKGLYSKAENLLQQYIDTLPDSLRHYWDLALTYFLQRKYTLALEEMENLLLLKKFNDDCYWLRGHIYLCMENFYEAEEDFRRLLESDELSWINSGRYGLVHLNLLKGRFKEAIAQIYQANEISKKIGQRGYEAGDYFWLGYLYFHAGQINEALEKFNKLWDISINENLLGWQQAVPFWKSVVFAHIDSFDEAKKEAENHKKLIEDAPYPIWQAWHFNLLGRLESEKGNFVKAIEVLKKSTSMFPFENGVVTNYALAIEPLALAYFKQRDLDNARAEYEKILALTGGRTGLGHIYAKAFYMLGKICEQQGDTAKAIEHYQKFLDLWKDADPGIAEVEDARERLARLRKD